ncbi:hypothetical protein ACFVXH_39885 [Kitasatospora sp. NPDC058184]|uniref:hypothetical protein n=1 Tax=Kitasatospora sp. NPDC058184 TaxID=3346370 RepID=UPI0036DAFAE3
MTTTTEPSPRPTIPPTGAPATASSSPGTPVPPTTPVPSAPPPSPSPSPSSPPSPPPSAPVLLLDPGVLADPADRERALVQLLRYHARVRTAHLSLEEGDRVELLEPLRTSWIDEDLAAEEYWEVDARTHAAVPAGTLGVVTLVRRSPAPFPYVVAFDRGPECAVRDHQIARCADQSLTPAPPPPPAPPPRRL